MAQNDDGHQKGPQKKAEDQHGPKTHERFIQQLHEPPVDERDNIIASHREGRSRLDESREQHDVAEAESEEKNKRNR